MSNLTDNIKTPEHELAEKYLDTQGTDYPIEPIYIGMVRSQIKSAFLAGLSHNADEIQRLKGLIEMLWKYAELDGSYEDYKKENNL